VLAGFLLIFGEEVCNKYNIINLHPAAPGGPVGMWQNVIWELIESDAGESGVKMHLVIPELDMGPTATYCIFPIKGESLDEDWSEVKRRSLEEVRRTQGEENPLFKLIRQHGVVRELPLVVSTVEAFSEGRVRITPDKRVVDADGKVIDGYDLSKEIDADLKTG
jgi:hypothetical protein